MHYLIENWKLSQLSYRQNTFKKWPHSRKKSFKPKASALALSGFFYNPYSSGPDNVTCIWCGKHLEGWESNDDPFQIHRLKSPSCPLMTLELFESRLATFGCWNRSEFQVVVDPKELAKAGFFLNCIERVDTDVVSCFQCGVTLGNWEIGDNPVIEHKKRNPSCNFLLHESKGMPCYYEQVLAGIPYLESNVKNSSYQIKEDDLKLQANKKVKSGDNLERIDTEVNISKGSSHQELCSTIIDSNELNRNNNLIEKIKSSVDNEYKLSESDECKKHKKLEKSPLKIDGKSEKEDKKSTKSIEKRFFEKELQVNSAIEKSSLSPIDHLKNQINQLENDLKLTAKNSKVLTEKNTATNEDLFRNNANQIPVTDGYTNELVKKVSKKNKNKKNKENSKNEVHESVIKEMCVFNNLSKESTFSTKVTISDSNELKAPSINKPYLVDKKQNIELLSSLSVETLSHQDSNIFIDNFNLSEHNSQSATPNLNNTVHILDSEKDICESSSLEQLSKLTNVFELTATPEQTPIAISQILSSASSVTSSIWKDQHTVPTVR